MSYRFLQPWHDFLPREGGHVLSVIGGGGKTSLLAAWTEFYLSEGIPVAITTTTRTEPVSWASLTVREWHEVAAAPAESPGQAIFVRQGEHAGGKWRGLTPEQVDQLSAMLPRSVVLVEADGSAGLPVKLHRPDEPPLPSRTSLAVPVVGLSAIGRPLTEVLHRAGELPVTWPAERTAEDLFTWDHLWYLLTGTGGYLERIPDGVPTLLALTQLAGLQDSLGLFGFLNRIMEEAGLPLVLLGELTARPIRIRTAYRWQGEATTPAAEPGHPHSPQSPFGTDHPDDCDPGA